MAKTSTDPAVAEPGQPVILQVLPHLDAGGVPRTTLEMAGAIRNAGWTALVASAGGGGLAALDRLGAVHSWMPLDTKKPWSLRRNAKLLAELITQYQVDIVHARSRAPAWSAYWAAQRTGTPFMTTFHGTYGHANYFKRRYNAVMIRGRRVIANSEHIASHIRDIYDVKDDRIRVIHRGVEPEVFDPDAVAPPRVIALAERWRLIDGMPVIVMPGRVTRWKGQRVLIEALASLGRDDLRCLIVGDDQGRDSYRQELEAMIRNRGVDNIVQFTGDCRDMAAAYMLADAVVSASTDPEAFGRVVIEAQAMGRPVIATDHGGPRETVRPGETGWLVPPDDPDALARTLTEVLALNADQRADLARRARAHVLANFTTAQMLDKTLAVYRELLAAEGPAPAPAR